MTKQNFIGCDPGNKGAFCLLRISTDESPEIHFIDGGKSRGDLIEWFDEIKNHQLHIQMALLEDVKSIFGVSAKSNFGFGRSVERAHFVLSIQKFGMDLVTPKVWQKEVGVKIPKRVKIVTTDGEPEKKKIGNNILIKKEVERLCNQMYPGCEIYGPKGGLLDGRSDALMIAHYCMLKYKI